MGLPRFVMSLLVIGSCQWGVVVAQEDAGAKKRPDVNFRVTMLDDDAVPLPTREFSVRQMNSLWHDGKYYVYADIIGWDNPHHPASYDSPTGVFSSPDGRKWTYHGLVVSAGSKGEWDHGGACCPGACKFRDKFYVAYSSIQGKNNLGKRLLGLAVAAEPLGPFRKLPGPMFPLEGYPKDDAYFADPCLVTRPGDDQLYLYYRYSRRVKGAASGAHDYTIRLRTSTDAERRWSEPKIVLRPTSNGGVVETIEAKWIDGQFVLVVLDYAPGAAMYVSTDGVHYERCRLKNFRDHVKFTRSSVCTHLPGLLVDGQGKCRFMNTAGLTDSQGHFTQWIYPVQCIYASTTEQ